MAFSTVMNSLRKIMLDGVRSSSHQRLVLNAADFAEGIISKLGPHDYGLVRERNVDEKRVSRAISRFTGRDALWTTVVSVPPRSQDLSVWWADGACYQRTFATACQLDDAFPCTRLSKTIDQVGKADRIAKFISDLGYVANCSINGTAAGLAWGESGKLPGYPIWYNTVFPVLKTLCLAAAFNLPHEADRVIELATVLREVLPLGEKKSQEFSWIVLAAPNP